MDPKNRVKTGHQSSDNPFTFIMSTEAVDRMGDVIRQKGWQLGDFRKNNIALMSHDPSQPIGTWENVRVVGKQLLGDLKLAKQGTSARIDEIRSLIEQKILKAVSVGFRVEEYKAMDKNDPYGAWDITKAALMETSVVAIPANQEALALAKSFGVSDDTLDYVFGAKGESAHRTRQDLGKSARKPTKQRKGHAMSSLAEKIQDGELRLDGLKDQIKELNDTAENEGRDLNSEEADLVNEYGDQIEDLSKSIAAQKRSEILMGQRAVEAAKSKATPRTVSGKAKAEEKPGTLFAKMALATIAGAQRNKSAVDMAEVLFGTSDERVKALVAMTTKDATNTATATEAGWAAELAQNETMGFIHDLQGNSVYADLSAMGTSLPFGNANSITFPFHSGSKKIPGSFVAENGSIPVKQGHLTNKTFNRYKMAVITAMTKEVINVSQPGILEIVRKAILDDTAATLDGYVVSTMAGVAGVYPPGLLAGAANQAATTPAGDALGEILTDIRYLRNVLHSANSYRSPAFLMHPSMADALGLVTNANGAFVFTGISAEGGSLLGTRVITSTHLDATIVTLTDAADWATAWGDSSFEMSDSATLVMVDDDGTDPSMYHSTTQAPGVDVAGSVKVSDAALVTGGPAVVKSMFQHNSTALKMIMPISYGVLRAGTTAYITGVSW